jgi:hypothetical protein
VRTAIAVAVLLGFWAALGYTYWPEISVALLRVVQSARSVGATEVESTCFSVQDGSSADEALVRKVIAQLEADHAAIQGFVRNETGYRVPVLIADGQGPAWTDGVRLNLYHDQGVIDLSTAPFFLVLLREGYLSLPGTNLFLEGGYAVYVVEGIGRAQGLLGQSSDAWVTLWVQGDTFLPLAEAWGVELPQGEHQVADVLRALLEGASFVRWMAGAYGLDAVQDLRHGLSIKDVTGLSFPAAERAWLHDLSPHALRSLPCAEMVPRDSILSTYCEELDPASP